MNEAFGSTPLSFERNQGRWGQFVGGVEVQTQVTHMSPEERARKAVENLGGVPQVEVLVDRIRQAIVEATNDEVEKRQEAERKVAVLEGALLIALEKNKVVEDGMGTLTLLRKCRVE